MTVVSPVQSCIPESLSGLLQKSQPDAEQSDKENAWTAPGFSRGRFCESVGTVEDGMRPVLAIKPASLSNTLRRTTQESGREQ